MIRSLARLGSVAVIAAALTFSAEAATVAKVSEDALQPLRKAAKGGRVRLEALPLEEGRGTVVDLEEFRVWAPDGKVLVHRESGVEKLDPPKARYFRGSVNGDHQSFAFFAVDANGRVDGLVVTRESKYAIAAQARPKLLNRHAARDGEVDHFLTRFEAVDELPTTNRALWACEVGKTPLPAVPEEPRPSVESSQQVISHGIAGTQSYEMTLEVETDYNLYVNAGSDETVLRDYVTNLVGAVSTIYNRDIHTNVVLQWVHVYTTNVLDPWTATDPVSGLAEVGRVYHNVVQKPDGRTTAAVALLSGVNVGGGYAWEGRIGLNDFSTNSPVNTEWGGPYSWTGGIASFGGAGLGSIPDPDASVGGTVYGMPSGTQNYWPLAGLAHELGHNMGGHHTHCVATSDAERVASGFTDGSAANSSSNFVDHCFTTEGAGCYGGTTNYRAGSQGAFKGTIMSYCHNVFAGGGVPQSRFTFGVASEPSQHQYDDYMLRAAGPIAGGGSANIVESIGAFTLSAISAPDEVLTNTGGHVATVTAAPATGVTYVWSITNGVITSGEDTNSITFTAGTTGEVLLRVSAYKATGFIGITDSRTVAIIDIVLSAPTGFSAAPTSSTTVDMTWNEVTDATGYEIFRASVAGNFVSIGTSDIPSYSDATAAADTAYLYKVRATAGAITGPDSASDLATTAVFTDPALTVGSTKAKLVHFTELLSAVNAVRTLAGLGAASFTAPAPATNVTIRRVHLLDLRAALDAARSTLGMPALSYTDPSITAGSTKIKAVHVTELRDGVL